MVILFVLLALGIVLILRSNNWDGNTYVNGTLACKAFTPPNNCINAAAVAVGATGNYIGNTSVEQQYAKTYSQAAASVSVTEKRVIHRVVGATGTLKSLVAGLQTANVGGATVTVDLYKNGSSVLTAPINLTNANTPNVTNGSAIAATFTSTSVVQGDILQVVVTATAGGGTIGNGVYADLNLIEDPQ